MTSEELFTCCLNHFSQSRWDPHYAQAEIDERWYTSELAAALLRDQAYTYPAYRFGSEESFNTLAAILGAQAPPDVAAKKIPDLTLVQFEPVTNLIFIVEAKVVRSVSSRNLSMKPGALGDQMEQAKKIFPGAAIYGFIAVELSPTFGQLSVPEQLAAEIEPLLERLSSNARAGLEVYLAAWIKAKNRTNAGVIWSNLDSYRSTLTEWSDCVVMNDIELHVNDACGKFEDLKEEGGLTCEQIDGPQGKALMAGLQRECSKLWEGHGAWITGEIQAVPNKSALASTGSAAVVGGLAIGLWEWKD
jgi:hypothetical protein